MVIAYLYYDTIGIISAKPSQRHSQAHMRLKYNVKSYMRLNVCTGYTKRRKTAQLQSQ